MASMNFEPPQPPAPSLPQLPAPKMPFAPPAPSPLPTPSIPPVPLAPAAAGAAAAAVAPAAALPLVPLAIIAAVIVAGGAAYVFVLPQLTGGGGAPGAGWGSCGTGTTPQQMEQVMTCLQQALLECRAATGGIEFSMSVPIGGGSEFTTSFSYRAEVRPEGSNCAYDFNVEEMSPDMFKLSGKSMTCEGTKDEMKQIASTWIETQKKMATEQYFTMTTEEASKGVKESTDNLKQFCTGTLRDAYLEMFGAS